MRRRDFLRVVAALAAASQARVEAMRRSPERPTRVGVIRSGILGTSIAYHLALRGAAVTLFKTAALASGATQNSFVRLNAFVVDANSRMPLRSPALALFRPERFVPP